MKNRKKLIYVLILIGISFFVFIICNNIKNHRVVSEKSYVENGVFKITPDNLNKSETVKLDGLWKFYPNNILTPEMIEEDEDNNKYDSMYIDVPSDWGKIYRPKDSFPGDGYGTYYMEIQGIEKYKEQLALKLGNIYTCYKI